MSRFLACMHVYALLLCLVSCGLEQGLQSPPTGIRDGPESSGRADSAPSHWALVNVRLVNWMNAYYQVINKVKMQSMNKGSSENVLFSL